MLSRAKYLPTVAYSVYFFISNQSKLEANRKNKNKHDFFCWRTIVDVNSIGKPRQLKNTAAKRSAKFILIS